MSRENVFFFFRHHLSDFSRSLSTGVRSPQALVMIEALLRRWAQEMRLSRFNWRPILVVCLMVASKAIFKKLTFWGRLQLIASPIHANRSAALSSRGCQARLRMGHGSDMVGFRHGSDTTWFSRLL